MPSAATGQQMLPLDDHPGSDILLTSRDPPMLVQLACRE
jgi:hypothetical protein